MELLLCIFWNQQIKIKEKFCFINMLGEITKNISNSVLFVISRLWIDKIKFLGMCSAKDLSETTNTIATLIYWKFSEKINYKGGLLMTFYCCSIVSVHVLHHCMSVGQRIIDVTQKIISCYTWGIFLILIVTAEQKT